MNKLFDYMEGFDHPLLFVFFITIAVFGMRNIIKWGADRTGFVGLKSTVQ